MEWKQESMGFIRSSIQITFTTSLLWVRLWASVWIVLNEMTWSLSGSSSPLMGNTDSYQTSGLRHLGTKYPWSSKCKLMQPLWRTRRKFLKKRKTATIWPSNPTPGHISRKDKDSKLKRYMHLNAHTCTIYQSQDLEETQVSIHRGMGKENVVCIYNGI